MHNLTSCYKYYKNNNSLQVDISPKTHILSLKKWDRKTSVHIIQKGTKSFSDDTQIIIYSQ